MCGRGAVLKGIGCGGLWDAVLSRVFATKEGEAELAQRGRGLVGVLGLEDEELVDDLCLAQVVGCYSLRVSC
jgi:hypothetical protein